MGLLVRIERMLRLTIREVIVTRRIANEALKIAKDAEREVQRLALRSAYPATVLKISINATDPTEGP